MKLVAIIGMLILIGQTKGAQTAAEFSFGNPNSPAYIFLWKLMGQDHFFQEFCLIPFSPFAVAADVLERHQGEVVNLIGIFIKDHRYAAENILIQIAQVDAFLVIFILQEFQCGYATISLNHHITLIIQCLDLDLIHRKITIGLKAVNQVQDILILFADEQPVSPIGNIFIFYFCFGNIDLFWIMDQAEIVGIEV